MDGKWVQRDDRPIFVRSNPFVRPLAQQDKGPLIPMALTEANLEARDFRLDHAAKVLEAFKKRKADVTTADNEVQTAERGVFREMVPHDCPHRSYKWSCKKCGGTGFCIHNKPSCNDCGYTGKCIHQRRHYTCHECKGGWICKHDKHKSNCKECKTVQNDTFCKHDNHSRKIWRCNLCDSPQ